MKATDSIATCKFQLSTGAYLESLINERENQRVYIPIERDIFDGRRLLTAKFGSIFPSDSYAMRDVLRKELDIAFMADEGEVIPTEYQPFLEYIQSLNPDENRYLMLQFISEYELREKMFKIMERRIRCIQIKGRGEMSTEQRNDLARYIMDAEDDVLALGIELEFLHLSKGQIYLRLKRTIGRDAELRAIDQRCDVLYSQIDLAKLRRLLQENYDQFERVFQMSAQVCAVDGEEIVNDSDPDESSEEGNDDAGDEHIEEARPPRREARERRYNEVQAKDAAICKHRGQGNMDKVGLKRRREGRAGTATSGRSGDGIIVEKGGTMGIGDIRGRKRRISTVESHVRVAVNARSVSAVMGSCMGVHYRSSEDTMLRRFSNGGAGLNIAAACSACCRHLLYTRIMNDKTKEVLETLRLTLTGYAVDNLYEKVIETALDWIFEPNINFSIVLDIIVALFSDTIVMDSIERVQFFLTGLEAFDELLLSKLCSPFDLTTEIIEYWTAISSSLETWIVAHNHQNSADLNGWRARVQAMLYRVSPKFFSLLITHALEGLDDDSLPSRFLRLLVWTTPYTPIEGAAQIHRYHTHWSHLTPIFTSMYDNDGHAWRFITLHSFILMVSTYDQESDARRITANWLQISRMDLEFSVSRSRCTYLACVWDDPSTCFKLLFHDPITPKAPGSDAWELTKPDYKPMMRLLETIVLDGMVHSADPDEMQAMVSAVFLGHGLSDLKHSWLGHAAQLIHNAFSPPAYPDQTLLKFVRTYFMKMPSDLSDSCRTKVSSFSWQEVLLMAATASGVLSMQNFRSDMLTPLDVLHFIRLFCSETKRSFVADYGGVILWTFTALFLLPSLSLHGSLLVKVLEALIQCIQGGGGSHLVNVLMLFMLTSIALKEFSHISQFPFQDNPELIHVLRHVLLFANNFEILFFDGDISIYLNSLILQAQIVQFLSSAAVSKMT